MKAVIFAGGLGTRMREETDLKPKPMVEIGGKPILWHLMKIYSTYGVNEFVILAGYKAGVIKSYFSNLDVNTRDFKISTLTPQNPIFLSGDSHAWDITILDTGEDTLTGERLLRAKDHIGTSPFFCTYGDGLAPVDLQNLLTTHQSANKVATMTVTQPTNRFGVVEFDSTGTVSAFREKPRMADWVNMGYFVFEPEIFDYLGKGEALEDGALHKLAGLNEIAVNKFSGFWEPMDTYREYLALNKLWGEERAPWKVW